MTGDQHCSEKKFDEFLICPVRGIEKEEKELLDKYVAEQERKGKIMYWPPRDTNQDDPIGLRICNDNGRAIKKARDGVRIYYNLTSSGSVFDLGMTFMADKPLNVINKDLVEKLDDNGVDDFARFISRYSNNAPLIPHLCEGYVKKVIERKEEIKKSNIIHYKWYNNNRYFLFDFGMAFMADKPILLSNREEVEKQRTDHKSFQNVLLALDDKYRKEV